jgi:hypothetical protein
LKLFILLIVVGDVLLAAVVALNKLVVKSERGGEVEARSSPEMMLGSLELCFSVGETSSITAMSENRKIRLEKQRRLQKIKMKMKNKEHLNDN